ncbi:MAG: VOC family protein [Ardenticatenales bacterium]
MSDAPPGIRLGRIGQVAQHVRDIEASVAFYRDALGLPLQFMAAPALAFFDCAGTRLMLSAGDGGGASNSDAGGDAAGDAPRPSSTYLYFSVADIAAARDTLRGRGVAFIDEPHLVARTGDVEVWMTFFKDPDGHPLALMSEVLGAPSNDDEAA